MTAVYLRMGCFGKLPFWREYLEANLDYPTAREFRRWLRESRAEAHDSGEIAVAAGDPAAPSPRSRTSVSETVSRRFLFGTPGSVDLMAGVIRPSTDEGGLRSFPFMVFAHFPRRTFGRHYALAPLALAPVWDALEEAWESLSEVTHIEAFREMVGSTLIPSPVPPEDVKGDYLARQQETFRKMFEGRAGATVDALLENLPGILQKLRSRPGDVRVEFPVSADREGACYDASFWVDLINHQFLLKRFEPSVFLEDGGKRADRNVVLAFGPLTAPDYPVLLGGTGAAREIDRPAASPDGGESAARSDITYAEVFHRRFVA